MIELERHIEILLLGNDCVIVPGLGGFVAHHVSARYDENDGLFLPPLRTLGFNPQLKMNDSLLAQSYSEAYNISYQEAMQCIENDVKMMLRQLDTEGVYEMNDIGSLRRNKDKNIEFTPCEAGILTPDFYGLSCFDLPSIGKETAEEVENTNKSTDKIVYIDSSAGRKRRTLNIRISALRDFAVAAAIIAFSFITSPPEGHGRDGMPNEQVKSGILCDILTQDSKKPTEKMTVTQAKPKHEVMPATAKTVKPANETAASEKSQLEVSAPKTYWSIVLCSHVQLPNAQIFCSQIEKEGLTGTIIQGNSGNAKVVYGKYTTEADAYAALNAMQDNERFKQGWITKIETGK